MAQLDEAFFYKTGVPGVLEVFCPHSQALGSTQPVAETSTKAFPWGKMRPARTADQSAVAFVPNVEVRMVA